MAKKILAMLLAAMMIVSIFAGCSNGGNDTSSEASTPAESSNTESGEDSGDEEPQEVKTLKVWQAYNWAWDKPGKEQDWDSYANCRAITEKIGIKLKQLASHGSQVICVTHSAQIAALADTHLRVSKTQSEDRTYTQLTVLDNEGRINEVARIMGGISLTDSVLAAAREAIENGRNVGS